MFTILMTGVTGQVGSSLARSLQACGFRVLYLIRPSKGSLPSDRLRNAIIGLRRDYDIAVSGDVTQPYAGMSESDRQRWKGKINMIIHGAASIKFDEASGDETRAINIDGTANMLQLADALGVEEFHYVSTAYIAGDAKVFGENDFDIGQAYRNPYESSKKIAEGLVRAWHGKFSIYRLSIVIGDSSSGYVNAFNGYYGFLLPFWRLFQIQKQKWHVDSDGCRKEGVCFNEDGLLDLPLTINCSLTSTLNLVTSDWVSCTLANLFKIPCSNQVYNIVNPDPPNVEWAIETSLRYLGITGLSYGGKIDLPRHSFLGRLQAMVNRGLKEYLTYVTQEPKFVGDNLRRVLKDKYVSPPIIDEGLMSKMVNFAISENFGQKER